MSKKKDLDVILATRINALWHVSRPPEKQESEYVYRVMARWYSEKFNYKLEEVDDVPVEFLAQHYYEAHYEDMSPEERSEEIRKLMLTEEDREAERVSDDDFLKNVALKEVAKAQLNAPKQNSAVKEVTDTIKKMSEEVKASVEELKKELQKPEIDMKFISEKEMEDMGSWDILGTPSSSK